MPVIIGENGHLRGRRFSLPERGSFGIGTDERCAIQLDDGMASPVHCVLRVVDGRARIEDNDSRNGTFVNDVQIRRRQLAAGDVIQVGETLLSFVGDSADPVVGQTISGYRITARIGRGMSGTVYRALQLSLDRTVALKILAPRLGFSGDSADRFLAEAKAVARLNHPHVVQVYDAGREGEHFFISMEFLDGGSLEEKRLSGEPLSLDFAIRAAIDTARALAFAEQNGIVHRDIKPANLLMTRQGVVKVCDLGIALDVRRSVTGESRMAGSPRYMAPEQAAGDPVDHRADIYGLGSTLYCLLAGKPPFEASTFREVVHAKLHGHAVPIRRLRADVPPVLQEVVHRMLARNPDDRYSSAEEVRRALEGVLQRMGPGRPVPGLTAPTARRRPVRRRRSAAPTGRRGVARRPNHAAVALASAIVVLVALVIVLRSLQKDSDGRLTRSESSAGDYNRERDKFVVTHGGDFNFGPHAPSGVHAPSRGGDARLTSLDAWQMKSIYPSGP